MIFPCMDSGSHSILFLPLGGLARKYIETLEVVHLAIIVRDEAFLAKGLFDHS